MRLLTPPWKTAWYDDQLSNRFFHELSKLEKSTVRELETSAQWMEQMVIEFGQLAQNMIQLEKVSPPPTHIRQAFEKALKLSVLAAHLTAALERADPESNHTPVGYSDGIISKGQPQANPTLSHRVEGESRNLGEANGKNSQSAGKPPRQTILSLSRKGLSVPEIEVITGQTRSSIETVLSSLR